MSGDAPVGPHDVPLERGDGPVALRYRQDRNALIEAKNSDNRGNLRQAIGQLYDYRRFHQSPISLAVLLPYQPAVERLNLLRSAGIEALWPHGDGFRDSAHGTFV